MSSIQGVSQAQHSHRLQATQTREAAQKAQPQPAKPQEAQSTAAQTAKHESGHHIDTTA